MARKLAKNVYVGETLYMAGSTPPKEDADQITNPAAWGDDSSDDADKGYADQKVADLKAEAEKRGLEVEGADGKAAVKADYVAALEADDAGE